MMYIKKHKLRHIGNKLIMIILVVFVCSITPAKVHADTVTSYQRFNISCESNYTKLISLKGAGYPITVTVENNGDDFSGTLELSLYQGTYSEQVIAYAQEIYTEAGETVCCDFNVGENIYANTKNYQIAVCIRLMDESGNILYSVADDFEVYEVDSYDIVVGVISADKSISKTISSEEIYVELLDVSGTLTIDATDLTASQLDISYLSQLSMLVIDKNVSDVQWESISEWIMCGGYALIESSVYEARFDKTADSEVTYYGIGRVLTYDKGYIRSTTVESLICELLGYDGLDHAFEDALPYMNISFKRVTSYDMWSEAPNYIAYTLVLIVYIIIIGPILYLILKKRGSRDRLWICIPCLAIFMSLVIYIMGSGTRYEDTFVRYATVVWLTDETDIELSTYRIVSPDEAISKASFSGDANVTIPYDGYFWWDTESLNQQKKELLSASYDVAIAYSENATEVLVNADSLFSEQQVNATRGFDSGYALDTSISYYNGSFHGSIVNNTIWDLENVFIYCDGVFALIGDIKAGDTIDIDADVDGIMVIDSSITFETDAYKEHSVVASTVMNQLLGSIDKSDGQCFVGGFTSDYDNCLTNKDEFYSVDGITLVLSHIDVKTSGKLWSSEIIADFNLYGTEGCYNSYDYILYAQDDIYISFDIDLEYELTYMEWLNPEYCSFLDISFYNFQTEEYELVFTDSDYMEAYELSTYIGSDGQIMAVISYNEDWLNGSNYYTCQYMPLFTMTGGEAYD